MYEISFIIALILTLVVEITVLFIIIKKIFKIRKIQNSKLLFIGFIASFATLPYLWFVFPAFLDRLQFIILGEVFVFLIELLIYNQFLKLNIKQSAIVSFLCNMASIIVGLLIF